MRNYMHKKETENKEKGPCLCMNTKGLFLHNRQVHCLMAGVCLTVLAIGGAAYFSGKRSVLLQHIQAIEYVAHEDGVVEGQTLLASFPGQAGMPIDTCHNQDAVTDNTFEQQVDIVNPVVQPDFLSESPEHYYAELVGFGSFKAATQCAERMQAHGFLVQVKKRMSKTARGKTIAWYQIITPLYDDKDSLSQQVTRIAKQERLKGVRIVAQAVTAQEQSEQV